MPGVRPRTKGQCGATPRTTLGAALKLTTLKWTALLGAFAFAFSNASGLLAADSGDLAKSLGISFSDAPGSTLVLERDGKKYSIDAAAHTIREIDAEAAPDPPNEGAEIFIRNCATCHGPDGRGNPSIGTPNFTDPGFQRGLTDQQIVAVIRGGAAGGKMPAFSGMLSLEQIAAVASFVRSFAPGGTSVSSSATPEKPKVYQPGDDLLFSLPTGRPLDRHAVDVNFTHRFAYDAAFTGRDRGAELFGLDNFALASFGFRYGVTDRLSVDVYRSPSFIGRPIQMLANYNILDERHEAPFNLTAGVSIEGQDNFRKNFTENLQVIFSRSLTSRAQIYVVPTASFNDRPLLQGGLLSNQIPDFPGVNAFSIGFGGAIDVRPTVALIAEVIPTLIGARELGIHRPAFSFAIQKKLYRHAFTLGLTTSPGTTVAQRAGTRATFLGDPGADTPGGLFIGFDLTRQIH